MFRPHSPSLGFFLTSAGLGAALMYFYDPKSGPGRRALARDRYNEVLRTIDEKRVRVALRRVVSRPRAIEVNVEGGVVELKGAVLSREAEGIVNRVRSMRGVRAVENHLSTFDKPEDLPSPPGHGPQQGLGVEFPQGPWTPAARSVAGGLGAILALIGLSRAGVIAIACGAIGGTLVTRAATNRDVKSLVGLPGRSRDAGKLH
jgi:hypothetical protein